MKRIFLMALALLLCVCMVACDADPTGGSDTTAGDTTAGDTTAGDTTAGDTTGGDTTAPPADIGVSEEDWNDMLSEESFENFTLLTEGNMTTIQGGASYGPYKTKSLCRMTADKMELTLYDGESDAPMPGSMVEVFEGEIAEAQKLQYSQLFVNILSQYESYTYDAQTKTYKIDELTVWDGTVKAISLREEAALIDVPCTIEIRNAEATLSEDGKLLKLVCDYTQSMTMTGEEITVFGVTTWTLSDYGSTVIG